MPLGFVSPLHTHRMALNLHMSVAELLHGRGAPMSARELCIDWPAYYEAEAFVTDRTKKKG